MRVNLLDQARAELLEYESYYRALGGQVLARSMLARIKQGILSLAENPHIAPQYELAPDIRRRVVVGGDFLIFYRVRQNVEVLHIRRAERVPATEAFLAETV